MQLIDSILALSADIRYAAVYQKGVLNSSVKSDLANTSSSESDKYEELIVNPTLLKLVTQRGDIDCGGAEYVIIRYGNFFELVMPLADGHLSVGMQLQADPLKLVEVIHNALRNQLV